MIDPINDPENEDYSEVECCRHCRELIRPGKEVEWNGWAWHSHCVPVHVLYGLDQELRDAEATGK